MVGKQGFMKTLEVAVAIVIVGSFLLFIIPALQNKGVATLEDEEVLEELKYDSEFQECINNPAADCINNTIGDSLGSEREYVAIVTQYVTEIPGEELKNETFVFSTINCTDIGCPIPHQRVYSESYMTSGNETSYSPVIVRLIYWHKT